MKIFLIIVIVYLFYRMVIKPYFFKDELRYDLHKGIEKALQESLEKTKKENELLKRLPTEEEIKKYYKMYLKKMELSDEWDTGKYQVPFEEFEERAKHPNIVFKTIELENGEKMDFGKSGGFSYLFEMTSDLLVGGQCIRLVDYETLVEEDEKKELTNVTE